MNSDIIKSAPVLPASDENFREEKGRKLVRAISAENIYICMLLFLGHILYRRAHFVRGASRAMFIILLHSKTVVYKGINYFSYFCSKT